MRTMKIHLFKTRERSKNQWRWNMKVGAKIVADSGEGYRNHSDCLRSLKRLMERLYSRRYVLQDDGAN